MMRFVRNSPLGRVFLILAMISIAICLGPSDETIAYGVAETGGFHQKGHNFMIKKAVEYLKDQQSFSFAGDWPLDTYLEWLIWGSWYADNTELECSWSYIFDSQTYRCDQIHHYGYVGDVTTEFGIEAANTGEFAAPYYSQILYDQAFKFWPGGSKPSLSELPLKDGGEISAVNTTELGETYVGGLPFCQRWALQTLQSEFSRDLVSTEWGRWRPLEVDYVAGLLADVELKKHPTTCPKWPPWATQDDSSTQFEDRYQVAVESRQNAMNYLGWALHIMQDVTVPQNAINIGDTSSEDFESGLETWIKQGKLDHLPVIYGNYVYATNTPVFSTGNYNNMEDLVQEARLQSIKLTSIVRTADGGYMWKHSESDYEVIADIAIKLTAKAIDRYFYELEQQLAPEYEGFNYEESTWCGSFSEDDQSGVIELGPSPATLCFELTKEERETLCSKYYPECTETNCDSNFEACAWHKEKLQAERKTSCVDYHQLECDACQCYVNAVFTTPTKTFDPSKCQLDWYRIAHEASCKKWDDIVKLIDILRGVDEHTTVPDIDQSKP